MGLLFMAASTQPARAQLQVIDYTLPITSKSGSDLTAAGDIPLGTPLHIQLTYDPMSAGGSTAGANTSYFFTSAPTHASFSIGDFTGELKPAISLAVSPLGFPLGNRIVPGDQFSFQANTLPASANSFYLVLDASFVFPSGSFDGTPVLPSIVPSIAFLRVLVNESENVEARFFALDFPNGPLPIGPVPEPKTYGAISAGLLIAWLAGRSVFRRRSLAPLGTANGIVA